MNKQPKKFANSREKYCPFCNALNPEKAYACIKCFKVMKDKFKVPLWYMQVRMSIGLIVFGIIIYISVTLLMRSLDKAKEAESLLHEQNQATQQSLQETK